MPGPWVFLKENLDFFEALEVKRGTYLDTQLYDGSHQPQGLGLWRVSGSDKRRKDGLWLEARLIAASDEHLNWWLREGDGKDHNRKFKLHLCTSAEADCRKTKRQPTVEFHTDYFRLLDVGDINEKIIQWAKSGKAKEDVEAEQARLQGIAPRGRAAKASGSRPSDTAMDWSVSDQGEADSNADEAADISRKLEALKKQVEKGREDSGEKGKKDKKTKAASKADPTKSKEKKDRKKGKSKKTKSGRKKKKGKRSSSQSRPRVEWFGRARKGSKQSSSRTGSSTGDGSSSSSSESEKPKKAGAGKKKKSKKRKRDEEADRGPYGVGVKQRYDGGEGSSGSEGSEDDEVGSSFRAGLSTKSQHLQLIEYAEKRPGRLASRLLLKMGRILSRQESPLNHDGRNLTPSTATSYFLTVVVPQYRDRLSLRTSREMRSTAKILDLVAQGLHGQAADVLAQRYKALEMSLADQNWLRAQHLELIPAEGAVLTEPDELVMATKEQKSEMKLKALVSQNPWRPREFSKGDEKGKTKGKGKGKKGQRMTTPGSGGTEGDKPPPA